MTQRVAASFLIRVGPGDDGGYAGIVTSVQTGEHAPFQGFAELARILERWAGPSEALNEAEEKT